MTGYKQQNPPVRINCTKHKNKKELFLRLLVFGILLAPFTKFLQLDFFSDELLIFTGPIIGMFASTAI
jgi:hypothetical protein